MKACPNYTIVAPSMSDKKPTENPAFFKGEFSFVNKDANNIDSKDHNAAVSWHVMNRYERWKKQEQAKKLRASANVPVGPMAPPGLSQSVRHRSRMADRSSRLTRVQSRSTTPAPPFGFDPWMADQPLQAGYPNPASTQTGGTAAIHSAVSTPSTHSSNTFDDPMASVWNTSHTSLDLTSSSEPSQATDFSSNPLVSMLISFAYGFVIANTWPTENNSVLGTYEIARSWEDVTAMAQDPCYSNAYLGLLAAILGECNDDEQINTAARQFQAQAMSELRRRVARNSIQDLITLKAILKLFCAETIIDNTAVARVHLKMLRNLVTAAGGVILLDSWFREDLLSCDCYFALKYNTRPTLAAQEWTPGPLSQPWKARMVAAGVVGDHTPSIDPLIEHPALKSVLTDLRELFRANEYVLTHDVPVDDQILRWRQLRKFDCISRLADHSTNLSIYSHLHERPKIHALATVAAALLTNMVLGCPEPVRFGLKLIAELKVKYLESQDDEEDESGGEGGDVLRLYLWVSYVGSLAEKVHPVQGSDAKFFSTKVKEVVRASEVGDWEAMKRILRAFLWCGMLHQEIENGRSFRREDFRQGLYTSSGISWRLPLSGQMEPEIGEGSKAAGKQKAVDG